MMDRVAFELFGRAVHWYGIIIVLGIIAGTYVAMLNAKQLNYNPDIVLDLCLLVIPVAVVMSRLYYVIFTWEAYMHRPIDAIKIWEGGLSIHGAVAGGVIAGWVYTHVKKLSFGDLADIAAPGVILGQAIGRWGNFFNQEAYGLPMLDPEWQWFPAAVYIEANQQWHMAAFFYESVWNFIVFAGLMFYKSKRKSSGEVFLLYMIFYSLGRLVIESIRMDSLFWGYFRVAQIFSVLLIVLGIILIIIGRLKSKRAQNS
jgi:prolipoprotein diacylglyceryl transferase